VLLCIIHTLQHSGFKGQCTFYEAIQIRMLTFHIRNNKLRNKYTEIRIITSHMMEMDSHKSDSEQEPEHYKSDISFCTINNATTTTSMVCLGSIPTGNRFNWGLSEASK